jgi:alanyl-tRNA synthetase
MNEELDEEVISTTPTEVVEETIETVETQEEESVEEIKARLAKAEELANNYKIRAEKAEKKSKTETKPTSDLSGLDIFALTKANVDSEDVEEVVNWAKYKNVPVSEALKSNELNAILNVRKDMRVTANASNTGASRRQTGKLSDEALLNQARSGKMPESEEDLDRLVRLKTFGGKK